MHTVQVLSTTERLVLGMPNPSLVGKWLIQIEDAATTFNGTITIQNRVNGFSTADVPQSTGIGDPLNPDGLIGADASWVNSEYVNRADGASTNGTIGTLPIVVLVEASGVDLGVNVSAHTSGGCTVYAQPLFG